MDKKKFNSLYILNNILYLILFIVLPVVLTLSKNLIIQYVGWLLLGISVLVVLIEFFILVVLASEDEDKYESGIIKRLTEIEYHTIINHSKHYLHDKPLDFKTSINDIKINNCNALPILTELNDIDIPKYQNYNECINEIKSLEPANETDSNEQTQQLNYLNEQKRILKTQILSKTQQIKDILDNEELNYKHQRFSDKYQLIKNKIDKL